MFVPGVVATANNGRTCQEPTSDLAGHHDGMVMRDKNTRYKTKEKESAPQAVSCDRHPGHTTSYFVLRGERRLSDAGCSHPADEHLVGGSHLEKAKRSKVDRW